MTDLLTDTRITEALERLPEWRHDNHTLVRTVELADFGEAIAMVNRVAEIAEHNNHHPDIDIRWRTLVFRCATHSAGGITALDVSLAEQIERALDR